VNSELCFLTLVHALPRSASESIFRC
jgi:hypothetical protein